MFFNAVKLSFLNGTFAVGLSWPVDKLQVFKPPLACIHVQYISACSHNLILIFSNVYVSVFPLGLWCHSYS